MELKICLVKSWKSKKKNTMCYLSYVATNFKSFVYLDGDLLEILKLKMTQYWGDEYMEGRKSHMREMKLEREQNTEQQCSNW